MNTIMKGISYITDNKNRKKAVLIAESRKEDEVISWEEAKKQLKKKGRL